MSSGPEEDAPDGVGSVGEEAAKLVGALSEWARDHAPAFEHGLRDVVDQAATAARDLSEVIDSTEAAGVHAPDAAGPGGPECTWCPVCRTAQVVRTPEVRDHLATAAGSLLQAVSALLAGASARPGPTEQPGVEHIDLDDDSPEER